MRSQFKYVLAAVSAFAMVSVAGCSASEGSIGSPSSSSKGNGQGNGSGGGTGSGTGTGSGNTGTGTGTGSGDNGATPPASGNDAPPSATGGDGTTPPASGGDGTTPPASGSTITANETWATGKMISGSIIIGKGVTVTIAASAAVTVADGATITVQGTLKGTSTAAAHAKLTGTAWGGLVVASGGSLALDGVDIDNATVAIDTQSGNVAATFDNSVINAATNPFKVEAGSKLSTTKSMVVGSKGFSSVGGAFTASYLDYDSNGSEGISVVDPAAVFTVDDSKFHGTSNTGGDMIVSNNAATLHISHSEIQKCHCAFHINNVTNLDVSFMSVHDTSYGFMQYGSDPANGTRTIASSNFMTLASVGIDESGTNGPIAVTGCYFNAITGGNLHLVDQEIKVTATATAAVAGVGPRP